MHLVAAHCPALLSPLICSTTIGLHAVSRRNRSGIELTTPASQKLRRAYSGHTTNRHPNYIMLILVSESIRRRNAVLSTSLLAIYLSSLRDTLLHFSCGSVERLPWHGDSTTPLLIILPPFFVIFPLRRRQFLSQSSHPNLSSIVFYTVCEVPSRATPTPESDLLYGAFSQGTQCCAVQKHCVDHKQ